MSVKERTVTLRKYRSDQFIIDDSRADLVDSASYIAGLSFFEWRWHKLGCCSQAIKSFCAEIGEQANVLFLVAGSA